jgi:integrase
MRSKTHARQYKDGKPRILSVRINRVYERTRAILRWALAEDIIAADPCGGIKKPIPMEPSRNIVLNELQLKAFWLGLDSAPMEPGTRIALKLSLLTAQRIGAVASIRNADLHLADERPHWVIPRLRKGRSRKIRRHLVPLTPLTMELVAAARAIGGDGEFLFPTTSKNGALTTSGVEVAWNRSRPKLGLIGINIHDLLGMSLALCSVTRHEALPTYTTIQMTFGRTSRTSEPLSKLGLTMLGRPPPSTTRSSASICSGLRLEH